MKIKNIPAKISGTAVVILLTSVVVLAVTTTLIVYPGNLEGWQPVTTAGSAPSPSPTPSVSFVFGPGVPPRGAGSVELRVGSDGDASAQMRQPDFAGTLLPNPSPSPPPGDELTGLSYSTYAQSGGSGGQTPFINLLIDNDNNGTVDDQLFFEPVYQNGTYPGDPVPNQCGANPLCVVPGQWQTWDAFNGGWWSLNAGTFGPPLVTLKSYRAAHPDARIVNNSSGLGGVRIVVGFGAGAWDNFIGNADAFTISLGNDPEFGPTTTIYDFEPQAPPPAVSAGVIISELRTSGPGLAPPSEMPGRRGGGAPPVFSGWGEEATVFGMMSIEPGGDGGGGEEVTNAPACCDGDDYVELYNTSDFAIAVQSSDGSPGWALVKRGETCVDPPVIIAVIPNGTIIPARGHYLLAGDEYSLSGYPAGNGTTAGPNQVLTDNIQDNRSIALFNTTNPSNFSPEEKLDAVGFDAGSGNTCDLLSEGTKLPAPRGSTQEHAFVRKLTSGVPQDTGDNASDFYTVSTTPDQPLGDNPTPVLGAPGPEDSTSPIQRNAGIIETRIAPSLGASQAPNRERLSAVEPCSSLGTLLIRRTYTNNTGGDVTRLRFRIIDITTFNSPGYEPGGPQADLRVRDSADETLSVPGRGTVSVQGLTLEQPPNQPAPWCGGINTSLSLDDVTLGSPLAHGGSVDVVFRFGVEQNGRFRLLINIEALP